MITLTTDFGLADTFVGQMKGVILSIAPEARIVDLTHSIRAHDIAHAARAIADSYAFFPEGTVHLVVVDPGVGTSRAPIILKACGHYFVGPDNGGFTLVLDDCHEARAWHINDDGLKGSTFHGRDLFAPTAARLEAGQRPDELGAPYEGIVRISITVTRLEYGQVLGEVVHVDGFGNLVTNIRGHQGAGSLVMAGREVRVVNTYAEGSGSVPCALVNSDGVYEVFVNRGRAVDMFGPCVGIEVRAIP